MSLEKKNVEEETKRDDDETLVLVQFTDLDDAKYSEKFSSQLKSIDISSQKPIIQIGNRLYSGEYTNNLGTYLFFEEKEKSTTVVGGGDDPNSTTTSNEFAYSGKSFKKLVLTRLFVEENQTNVTESS